MTPTTTSTTTLTTSIPTAAPSTSTKTTTTGIGYSDFTTVEQPSGDRQGDNGQTYFCLHFSPQCHNIHQVYQYTCTI